MNFYRGKGQRNFKLFVFVFHVLFRAYMHSQYTSIINRFNRSKSAYEI